MPFSAPSAPRMWTFDTKLGSLWGQGPPKFISDNIQHLAFYKQSACNKQCRYTNKNIILDFDFMTLIQLKDREIC